jgi:hypothetical protein
MTEPHSLEARCQDDGNEVVHKQERLHCQRTTSKETRRQGHSPEVGEGTSCLDVQILQERLESLQLSSMSVSTSEAKSSTEIHSLLTTFHPSPFAGANPASNLSPNHLSPNSTIQRTGNKKAP